MKFIMDNHSCSVYELITKLCERMLISSGKKPNKENIKKLRAISYEILLSKKISRYVGLNLLEDNKDPICNLLAWQLMLVYRYKLPEHAKKIQNNLDVLEKSGAIKDDVVKSVLFFLIQLRNPPEIESGISSLSLLSGESCIKYRIFSKHSFHLNLPPICSNAKYNNSSFYFNPPPSKCCDKRNFNCEACMRSQIRSSSCSLFKDLERNDEVDQIGEEDSIKSKFEDPTEIWELVSKTVYTKHRTWESLGNPCPEKEKDFLTDSSLEVINLFHEFIRGKEAKLKLNFDSIGANKVVKRESFIKHLRLLLVGTSSDSFDLNENNEMFLIKNVTIDGVSREALEDYSKDLIFCGTFYRVLNNFCQMDMKGFVLKAFCNSLQEYLSFYRVATFTISEKMGLLCVSNHMKPLYEHLKNLISICRIDRSKNGGLPSAVDLLNDLYERLSDFPVKEIGMLLCSSFSTCVQVYFGRFLQQWIFDGILNDPHDEFFIANSRKSLKPISRSYWTKCFVIKEEKVPDFLIDLAKDVLYCGKVMNLLKICAPKNPLCINLVAQKRALLRCCLSWGEISELEENVICYKYESILKCGSKFCIKEYLLKIEEDDAIIADLVVKKRAEAIKRLEMEKLEVANRLLEEKRRNVAILKADYDKALLDKKEAITRGMLKELEVKRANLKLYCLRKQVVEEEAKKLVNYYDKLMEESDRKLLDIQRHLNRGKMIEIKPQESFYSTVEIKSDSNSDSSFHSAISNDFDENNPNEGEGKKIELTPLKLTQNVVKENNKSICSELDSINANLINNEVENELIKMVRENKEAALKNKMRVMSDEMGFIWNNNNNKDCCGEPKIESNLNVVNENFKKIDENVLNNNNNTKEINLIKNDRNLTLNLAQNDSKTIFSQFWKSPNFEFPKPMSIDSTPSTSICSKSTIEFQFNPTPTSPDLNNLEKQIEKSVSIPLKAQINLIDNELLRHFFVNLKYLDHLKLFRSYFFLLDGEFSRNITEELFNKLYKGKDSKPTDLLNVSTLQNLIRHALDSSIKSKGEFASILSFKINNIPKNFDLNDPDVLSCLSLSYEVKWPLNVLLPKDIVAKYDEVFKFLLKLNMVSWVLKEMFQLMEESDRKLLNIQKHLNRAKTIEIKPQESFYSTVEIKSTDSNSDSSFHSAISNDFDENNPNEGEGKKIELTPLKLTQNVVKENNKSICSELDSINANLINNDVENELIKMVRENKEAALKNKMRVMSDEMGFIWNNNNNKDCCGEPKIESNLNVVNENFKKIDENVLNNNNNTKEINLIKNDRNLTLNLAQNDSKTIFSQFWKSPNFEFPKPMSIDSTPSTSICSKSTIEFQFNPTPTSPDLNNLEKQIEKSVSIPLKAQINLIDNELLRHFFVNLKYLDHLKLFRSYFFLLDGEFSRNITEELFNKLYKGKDSKPTDLLNVSTLQNLIRHALDSSIKSKGEFASILSFKINNIPKNFDLNDPDVLSCLSLSYEVKWPLNVLLPKDIVAKYDEVFKFLLKLNMVSWVLKEMFQTLKIFSRQCGQREGFLILSPHFKKIQSFRHRMSQFLQALQNYVMSEVLQPSWSVFEKKVTSAINLDDLYNIHTAYIKDILFKCLLNKRFTPVREVIENVVTLILKFFRYLSSGRWVFDDDEGVYSHTNMKKLETIFRNFEEFAVYIFKVGHKIVRVGYQPHLLQLLDMLDVNQYYSKNINSEI